MNGPRSPRPRFPRLRRFADALRFAVYNRGVTRFPSFTVRHWYLRRVLGYAIGPGATIHMDCFFTGRRFTVGANSTVNRRTYLDCRGGLTLGENVSVSPECYLLSVTHDPNSPDFAAVQRPTRLADYAWLGARAMILPGRDVGYAAVVGAGAVVSRAVPDRAIVAGNPARPVGRRDVEPTYQLRWRPWFDTDLD